MSLCSSRFSFLSLKARVIILYGVPFVNTFFYKFLYFFQKGVDISFYIWYSITCREGEQKNPKEMRYAEVSELADEQD